MTKRFFSFISATILLYTNLLAQSSSLLVGNIICDNGASQFAQNAFDGNTSTDFLSSNASHAWIGLDLSSAHIITKVRWYNHAGTYIMKFIGQDYTPEQKPKMPYSHLAVFEGANHPDFTDAVPLYLVTSRSENAGWNEADIMVDRGFRYVRYVGPNSSYGRVCEVEFYGYPGEGNDQYFYQPTNIPLLVVHTQSGEDFSDRETNLNAESYLIYNSKKGNSKILGDTCTIRGRGNNSWHFAKKGFRIKFNHKVNMPHGGTKAKKWTVIGAFGDKTLMRTALSFDMSRRLEMPYTPYCQPVDLILNGEYKGLYQLCDQLEVANGRVELEDTLSDELEDSSDGFFFEYDANNHIKSLTEWQSLDEQERAYYDVGFLTSKTNPITIKSPDKDEILQSQFDYLKDFLSIVESEVYSGSTSIPDYIDLESFARFFIVSEFTANTDTFFETYQYKKRGSRRVCFGPCWDLDLTYDNDDRSHDYLSNPNATSWLFQKIDGKRNGGSCIEDYASCGAIRSYVNKILDNNTTKQKLIENWAYVRASGKVSMDALTEEVEVMKDSLLQSQELNFYRWPILNTYYHMNYQVLGDWNKEVKVVSDYIKNRLVWFDDRLSLSAAQYEISIPESEWTTIYCPYAVHVPEQLTVFSPSSVTDRGTLQLDEVETTRPNRPYLVHGAPGQYTLSCYSVPPIESEKLGLLTGTHSGTLAPIGSYVLQKKNDRLAFYRVEEEQTVYVNASNAYLSLAEDLAKEVGPIIYLDEQSEGISELHMAQQSPLRVYTLTGELVGEYNGEWSDEMIVKKLMRGTYILTNGQTSWKLFSE